MDCFSILFESIMYFLYRMKFDPKRRKSGTAGTNYKFLTEFPTDMFFFHLVWPFHCRYWLQEILLMYILLKCSKIFRILSLCSIYSREFGNFLLSAFHYFFGFVFPSKHSCEFLRQAKPTNNQTLLIECARCKCSD